MNLFFLNIKLLVERLIPPFMRGDIRKAWLWSLHEPLQTFWNDTFTTYRNRTLKLTDYNAQDKAFEKILNDELGITESPFIFIDNFVSSNQPTIFYNITEGKVPVYFRNSGETFNTPVFMRNPEELQPDFDYIIFVPSSVYSDLDKRNKIISLNDQIKLTGVNNDIQPY
jgi:hypothetical protein